MSFPRALVKFIGGAYLVASLLLGATHYNGRHSHLGRPSIFSVTGLASLVFQPSIVLAIKDGEDHRKPASKPTNEATNEPASALSARTSPGRDVHDWDALRQTALDMSELDARAAGDQHPTPTRPESNIIDLMAESPGTSPIYRGDPVETPPGSPGNQANSHSFSARGSASTSTFARGTHRNDPVETPPGSSGNQTNSHSFSARGSASAFASASASGPGSTPFRTSNRSAEVSGNICASLDADRQLWSDLMKQRSDDFRYHHEFGVEAVREEQEREHRHQERMAGLMNGNVVQGQIQDDQGPSSRLNLEQTIGSAGPRRHRRRQDHNRSSSSSRPPFNREQTTGAAGPPPPHLSPRRRRRGRGRRHPTSTANRVDSANRTQGANDAAANLQAPRITTPSTGSVYSNFLYGTANVCASTFTRLGTNYPWPFGTVAIALPAWLFYGRLRAILSALVVCAVWYSVAQAEQEEKEKKRQVFARKAKAARVARALLRQEGVDDDFFRQYAGETDDETDDDDDDDDDDVRKKGPDNK